MVEIMPHIIALILCIVVIILCVIRLFYFGDTGISRAPYMLIMMFTIYLIFCCSFSLKEKLDSQSTSSKDCNHQWVEVSSGGAIRTIYCPACKSEKEVDNKEWNKIQADAEYQKGLEEQGKDE